MTTRYFNIANILLLTAGVFLCVKAFYALVTPQPDFPAAVTPATRPVSASRATHSQPPPGDYSAIAERNIFNSGTEAIAPKAPEVDLDNLKQTDMKLKLWGTVTGQNGRDYAVIEDTKTRKQNLYHAGDTIQNATVKLILREKVVLNVDNRDEILAMEEIRGRRATTARTSKTRSLAASSTQNRKLPVSRYPRKIKLRSDQIQNAMENLGELMDQATLRPHIENGQAAGISITGIKPNAIFRRMRLRNGDVITGVNGNSIDSVEDAVKVFEELSTGSGIQLQIKRRGREQTLDYSIE